MTSIYCDESGEEDVLSTYCQGHNNDKIQAMVGNLEDSYQDTKKSGTHFWLSVACVGKKALFIHDITRSNISAGYTSAALDSLRTMTSGVPEEMPT